MAALQESFIPSLYRSLSQAKRDASFGGGYRKGQRKEARPIDPRQALHIVLRSSKARGNWSLLHPNHHHLVHEIIHQCAERWGVRIFRFANVGNHVHLLIKVRNRALFRRFLREATSKVALLVTGARKGRALRDELAERAFWDNLAFSRIVGFGRDFAGVDRYLIKNLFEAHGLPMKRLLAQGFRILSTADPVPG